MLLTWDVPVSEGLRRLVLTKITDTLTSVLFATGSVDIFPVNVSILMWAITLRTVVHSPCDDISCQENISYLNLEKIEFQFFDCQSLLNSSLSA